MDFNPWDGNNKRKLSSVRTNHKLFGVQTEEIINELNKLNTILN